MSLALAFGIIACGGGGGGGDGAGGGDSVTIEGTLRVENATARVLGVDEGGIAGIQIDSLGDSAVTDENGNFVLSADGNAFIGGEAQFTFTGAGVNDTVILAGLPGGPGAQAFVNFVLEDSGRLSGESTDIDGNVLGTTPGGNLGCSTVGNFFDGGSGALWKPHSERTGTVVILMPPEYSQAGIQVLNVNGDVVANPLIRDCCSHNGGREHIYLDQSAGALAASGVPLTVRFEFPDGFVDCREVANPAVRND